MEVGQDKPVAETLDEEVSETLNLKHDLDLQRLLKESHMLEEAKASSALESYRHKATDLRLQALGGSKSSIFTQQKMPMIHRKGIAAKSETRETLRRKEAKENGVVLEKLVDPVQGRIKRDRGVDKPSLGKFQGGTLKLSKGDVASIQGSSQRSAGRKKGRR
jgi:hypothetical protein